MERSFESNVLFSQDPRQEVLQAWYMDDSDEDQRLPHHKEPKEFVSFDQLAGKFLLHVFIKFMCRLRALHWNDLLVCFKLQNLESLAGN